MDHDEAEFVSEPIEPEAGSFDAGAMVKGLAGLPRAFTWRGQRFEVRRCLGEEKRSAREGHTRDGELYLRRQEFTVELDTGQTATIYVLRQPPRGSRGAARRRRWFLLSITPPPPAPDP